MADYRYITYETLDEGLIARIMLNRPDARNAQNRGMLVELNDAFLRAEADDQVRVVILGGMGPMFSSGHDLGSKVMQAEYAPGPDQLPSYRVNGGTRNAAEKLSARHCAAMLRPDLIKENIDGEAIEWAASRLRRHGERLKCQRRGAEQHGEEAEDLK